MCRHVAVLSRYSVAAASAVLEDRNNLLTQACGDARGECHGDGWGIGWYEASSSEPRVVRSPADARTDPAFRIAAQGVTASTFIAHVRDASVGERNEANSHPFAHGPWLFAHNGTLRAFEQLADRIAAETDPALLACRRGTTDSEAIFYWLLTRLRNTTDDQVITSEMGDSIAELARRSREYPSNVPSKFNLLLANGRRLWASRWEHDLCWIEAPDRVIVASEPIGEGSWQEVPEHSILSVDTAFRVRLHQL
jgi:glutamine amidotransferase